MKRRRLTRAERLQLFWRELVYQQLRDVLSPAAEQASESDQAAALEWVFDDSRKRYAFRWVCEQADLDPEAVRQEIRARGKA